MTFNQRDPIRKKQNKQQNVFGSNLVKSKPLGKVEGHPKLIEFELVDLHQVWAMGPSTHFVVQGRFEFAQEPKDGKMPVWLACTEEELDKMVVWKYNYMDKIQKKKLCPNDVSPGVGVHSKEGGWDMDEPTSEWRIKFKPKIFLWAFHQIL